MSNLILFLFLSVMLFEVYLISENYIRTGIYINTDTIHEGGSNFMSLIRPCISFTFFSIVAMKPTFILVSTTYLYVFTILALMLSEQIKRQKREEYY